MNEGDFNFISFFNKISIKFDDVFFFSSQHTYFNNNDDMREVDD